MDYCRIGTWCRDVHTVLQMLYMSHPVPVPPMPTEAPTTIPWPVRLPADLLRRWRALATSRGLTAAGLLRQAMVRELDGADATVGLSERAAGAKTGRLSLTLPPDDIARVREVAAAEGHSLAGWISRLIRARLAQQPLYTSEEREVLSSLRWSLPSSLDGLLLGSGPPPPTAELVEQVLVHLRQLHEQANERTRQLRERT